MLPYILVPSLALPSVVAEAPPCVHMCSREFFAANIRNAQTRRAYAKAARDFLTWFSGHEVRNQGDISPIHVATWMEMLVD